MKQEQYKNSDNNYFSSINSGIWGTASTVAMCLVYSSKTRLNSSCSCEHLSDASKNFVHKIIRAFKKNISLHIQVFQLSLNLQPTTNERDAIHDSHHSLFDYFTGHFSFKFFGDFVTGGRVTHSRCFYKFGYL